MFYVVEFTLKYIQETGFTSPVIIKSKDGLGMRYVDRIVRALSVVCNFRFCAADQSSSRTFVKLKIL